MSGAGSGPVPCQRPDCAGRYEDVGDGRLYCDLCGLAPVLSPRGDIGTVATGLTVPPQRGPAPSPEPEPASAPAGSAPRPAPGPGPDSGGGPGAGPGSARSLPSSRLSHRSVSGSLSRSGAHPFADRSVSVRSSRSTATGSRHRLGAGLVTVPPVPRPDPLDRVLADPEVPERKRFCGNSDCGERVGRTRGDRPGRSEGYCTRCGHPYSFVPKLRPGDLVHDQYEIAGCLAHGGLGWIYLARDTRVSNRWVVLKGLLDTGDDDAMEVAISERRFLAEIEHSTIVRIYNFVEHLDRRTGSLDGYIVMEYVGGRSLKEIANARRTPDGRRDPLPVEQACAYGIEALDALAHLHSRQLLYCDFKVDNAIQQNDQLKLIDMGAVRRMDDTGSAVWGTVGYQAPEVAEIGPSVASDLYTVARTLAVLTFDFQGYTTVFQDSLPEPEHVEVFQRYESFYRLLVRATDPDPERRFSSAQQMSEQLTGVLREVVALQSGQPQPALSQLFGPELRVPDTELMPAVGREVSALGARRRRGKHPRPAPASPAASGPLTMPVDIERTALSLPVPKVAPDDPNAGFLSGLTAAAPSDLLGALNAAPADSVERRLRELRALLELPDGRGRESARLLLAGLENEYGDDWRVVWYQGVAALATGDLGTAALSFDAVYDAFPGEVAPKLALAVCAETLGQLDNAADYYELVWRTDPSHVSAGFGLARVRLAAGDRERAVAALESVPDTSAHHIAARVAAVRARLRQRSPAESLLPDLLAAGRQVEALLAGGLEPSLGEQLSCEVLGSALDWLLSGHSGQDGRLLGTPLEETGIRLGLERSYRRLAQWAPDSSERIELVEAANRFRPRTWV